MLNNKKKTIKSLTKRFKVTKTGKVKKIRKSQNNFNAKETGKKTRNKRRDTTLSLSHARAIKKIIS